MCRATHLRATSVKREHLLLTSQILCPESAFFLLCTTRPYRRATAPGYLGPTGVWLLPGRDRKPPKGGLSTRVRGHHPNAAAGGAASLTAFGKSPDHFSHFLEPLVPLPASLCSSALFSRRGLCPPLILVYKVTLGSHLAESCPAL